jgi:4-amino-4-deoxy-L-arabinose transferase-like glycosyltransferase
MSSREACARLFWIVLAGHVFLWTGLPSLLAASAPLDVIEGLAWGREWQAGYWKHPPLAAWLLAGTADLFGPRLWPLFLLGQLVVAAGIWGVWQLGLELLGPTEALTSVLMLEGIYYYTIGGTKLNPDLLQLALWPLSVLYIYRALVRGRLRDWTLGGLGVGLGLLAKYYMLALLAPLALLLALTAEGRRHARGLGPWLALSAAAACGAPHVIWLVGHDFLPLAYARARAGGAHGLPDRLREPFLFAAGQFLALLPAGWLAWNLGRPRLVLPRVDRPRLWFLLTIALGPVLVTLGAAAILGLRLSGGSREAWGTPLWSSLPLLLLAAGGPTISASDWRPFARAWGAVVLATALFYAASLVVAPSLGRPPRRETFPGRDLAAFLDRTWRKRFGTEPAFAAGDVWLAGNLSLFGKAHAHVYIDLDPRKSPWIDELEVEREGAVVLWDARDEAAEAYRRLLRERYPRAELQPIQAFGWQTLGSPAPFLLGWAILPPAAGPAPSTPGP